MSAYTHLNDVMVSRGYQGAEQAKFTAGKTEGWGRLRIKASVRRNDREGNVTYDNYSILVQNIKADHKVIGFLNQEGVRINVSGHQTQESYEGRNFIQISCPSSQFVNITKFPNPLPQAAPADAAPAAAEQSDDLPF